MSASDHATKLAEWRDARGLSQRKVAELIGLSLPAYKRLERGELPRPRLAYFVNASIVLDVPLEVLIDEDYLTWRRLSDTRDDAPAPPHSFPAEMLVTEEWEQRDWEGYPDSA